MACGGRCAGGASGLLGVKTHMMRRASCACRECSVQRSSPQLPAVPRRTCTQARSASPRGQGRQRGCSAAGASAAAQIATSAPAARGVRAARHAPAPLRQAANAGPPQRHRWRPSAVLTTWLRHASIGDGLCRAGALEGEAGLEHRARQGPQGAFKDSCGSGETINGSGVFGSKGLGGSWGKN